MINIIMVYYNWNKLINKWIKRNKIYKNKDDNCNNWI